MRTIQLSIMGLLLRTQVRRHDSPDGLIQECFGFVRYPFYLSYLLIVFGLGFASNQAAVFAVLLLLVSLWIRKHIQREESLRRRLWGPDYANYAHEVSAVFPQLFSLKSSKTDFKKFYIQKQFSPHLMLSLRHDLLFIGQIVFLSLVLFLRLIFKT